MKTFYTLEELNWHRTSKADLKLLEMKEMFDKQEFTGEVYPFQIVPFAELGDELENCISGDFKGDYDGFILESSFLFNLNEADKKEFFKTLKNYGWTWEDPPKDYPYRHFTYKLKKA